MPDVIPDSQGTQALLRAIRGGDRGALEELLARHRLPLRAFVELRLDARLRARVDPSDVVQETQLEVFRRLDDYLRRRPMPFRLWLFKTAFERLVQLRRRHLGAARRAAGREVPLPDGSSLLLARQMLDRDPTPGAQLDRRELARRVQQALARLPEADRDILLMRNYEGLSYAEAAAILDIDPAAARKRHGRALLRLHGLLAAEGEGGGPA
jgi:RNA polymerase sigma-70 factor (ECF subfamily)